MKTLKEEIKTICIQRLEDKIDAFQVIIEEMTKDAQSDAKSSAGDKHETGLSRLHIEQENLSKKIEESIVLRDIVKKIDATKVSSQVEFGSIVKINSNYLFISAALPKIVFEDLSILAISVDAPISKELLGKKLYDTFFFNKNEFKINELF